MCVAQEASVRLSAVLHRDAEVKDMGHSLGGNVLTINI